MALLGDVRPSRRNGPYEEIESLINNWPRVPALAGCAMATSKQLQGCWESDTLQHHKDAPLRQIVLEHVVYVHW